MSRRGPVPPAAARGWSKDPLLPTARRLAWAVIGAWESMPGRFRVCCRGRRPRRPRAFPILGHALANSQHVGRGLAPAVLRRGKYRPPGPPPPKIRPRRQLRHSGAVRPAQMAFRLPAQAVTAGAGGDGREILRAGRDYQRPGAVSRKMGRSRRGRGLWVTAAAQRRRGTHRARAPLSASLGTFSTRRKYLALRRNI